jgi:hypothetical protein
MKILALATTLVLTFLATEPTSEVQPFAGRPPTIRSGPPRFAFNGRDLSGFAPFTRNHRTNDPNGVFSVKDGMIRISGLEFGGLSTVESFADYHLIIEWRWGSRTFWPRRFASRNSGVMVHCVGPNGAAFGSFPSGIECQIIEGGTGDLLVVPGGEAHPSLTSEVRTGLDGQPYFQPGGEPRTLQAGRFNWWGRDPDWKDVLWFRGPLDPARPHGEWNRMEVVCDGASITVLLNDVLVNAATRTAWSSGKIFLQSEGAEIFFRKVEVRPLLK